MRYAPTAILFFHFFFTLPGIYAQPYNNYPFRHMDQSDGLLHNWVFSITQDAKGFIWMLTRNGLQRYDGSRFVNYPYDINRTGGMAYSSNCSLYADNINKRLWVTGQSIEMLDLQKNKFILFPQEQIFKDPFFEFESYHDSLNNNWFAGNFGVFPDSHTVDKKIPYDLGTAYLSPGKSNPLFIDRENGEVWFTKWGIGLLLFDKRTKKIYSHTYNPLHHPLLQQMDKKELLFVFADSQHNIWIGSSGPKFYQYNFTTKKVTAYSLYGSNQTQGKSKPSGYTLSVICFFEDDHHTIWLGTQNAGLLRYNKEADQFTSVTTEKENKKAIKYNYSITCIFQDSEENIWLGTDKGITLFNPYQQYFQSVYHEESNPLSLPDYEIQHCIETSNGDILVGTWGGGITVYDNHWHFKKNLLFPSSPEEYNLLWSFVENDDGTIWAGCQHGYIHIYDPIHGILNTLHPTELNNFTIRCMAKDKKGNILMGLHNGKIAKWDPLKQRFYPYNENVPGNQQTFAPVFVIFIDELQRCWAGTENGLKQFDMDKMVYSANYAADKTNPYSLSANTILSIDRLDDSTLVIGTLYGGLNFFNTYTKTFSLLSTNNGLPFNTINNLKKDKENNIWFTTDYSLYKYITGNKQVIKYNIYPGILNSSFKPATFCFLKDGRWLISTATEIISFNPDVLKMQQTGNRKVEITGFKVFDQDFFIDSFLYINKPVKLSYEQNILSIEYGVPGFSGLQETKYYYQLTGINKDWVNAGSKRFANYTNLEPGEYDFRVKTDEEGNNPTITSFSIIITPPFWKTTGFRLIVFFLAATFVYFLYRRRISSIRHEAEMKQKIAETEMMALRAQMNPHFIFNCLNAIDNLIQTNQKAKATTYLARFAKLIRSVLDSSKNKVVPFQDDYESLQLYLQMEQFRCNNKFLYELEADEELLTSDYKLPPLIVQPFVENAIHHGLLNKQSGDRKLTLSAILENDIIKYTIIDNGVGRAKAQDIKDINKPGHQSYGISITKERVNIYNQNEKLDDISITDLFVNGMPAGTKVEIRLKIYDNNKHPYA